MLPVPLGSLGLLPASPQLAAVTLPKYRELLRKLKSNGSMEESSSAFQQAKERVLLRLQQRRERARLDPNRAFRRLRDRMIQARLSLRELKDEQKERLRQYYYEAVRGTAAAMGAGLSSLEGASGSGSSGGSAGVAELASAAAGCLGEALQEEGAAEGGPLDPRRVEETLGPNGVFRALVLAGVGTACKAFLHGASRTTITGQEVMRAALERPPGQALITVSNHVGSIDDPLITAAVVPPEYLLRPEALRWTMCASDRCFKSKLLAPFFKAAKVLPVERGAGLAQYGMRVAQSRLAAGDWVHIFPEGTRSRTGKMGPVRKGVGWLVASCQTPPLVVPFVHSGMEKVIPKGAALPQTGQEVRVAVGQPVEVADLLMAAREEGWGEEELHVAITQRVGQALYALKAELDGLPLEEVVPQRAVAISEETLLPLIEEEMDSMRRHRWRDSWQRSGLPSLTHRMREALRQQAAELGVALGDPSSQTQQEGGAPASSSSSSPLPAAGSLLSLCEEGVVIGAGDGAVAGQLQGVQGKGSVPEAAAEGARAWRPQGGMLRALQGQQGVLHMLRGSRLAGLRPAAELHPGSELSMGAAAEASSAGLPQLMSAAADYSSDRVCRMRQLVGQAGPSAGLA